MSSGAWSGQPSGDPFGAAWYGEEGQLSTRVQGPRMCRVHTCAGSTCVQGPRVCRSWLVQHKPWAFRGPPSLLLLFLHRNLQKPSPQDRGRGMGWALMLPSGGASCSFPSAQLKNFKDRPSNVPMSESSLQHPASGGMTPMVGTRCLHHHILFQFGVSIH